MDSLEERVAALENTVSELQFEVASVRSDNAQTEIDLQEIVGILHRRLARQHWWQFWRPSIW